MINSRLNLFILAISLLLPLPTLWAGGKHLEVMVPLCKQGDLHGKPHQVTEQSFESRADGEAQLESVAKSDYDKAGNLMRVEVSDAANRMIRREIYGYDADGTWVWMTAKSEDSERTWQVYVDVKTKRIAKVDAKLKETEFISYTEQGFEAGTVTQSSVGKAIEKTVFTRNSNNKEERVIFEEPAGTKATEILVRWTPQGFEETSTMIFYDRGGDKIVTSYSHPEVDAKGNWLTQIQQKVLHLKNGEKRPMPVYTVKRAITYHPE